MTPFEGDGVWLRCALHAHTTNSDGELAPDMLVRHYEWAGFDVLAITDHWVRTVERSTRKLLVIPSTELNAQAGGPEHDAHVLALGVEADPVIPEGEFAPLQEVVTWIDENGGVPYIAHTYWSGLRTDQWEDCEGLLGLEVWNAGCELEIGRGDSSIHWDEALERGRQLLRARNRRLAPPRLRQRLRVDDGAGSGQDRRRRCSPRCARAPSTARPGRRSRASRSTDDVVTVRCSPAESVTLVCGPDARRARQRGPARLPERRGDHRARLGRADHRVRLEKPWNTPYGRLEVADATGRRAWTNPLWIA